MKTIFSKQIFRTGVTLCLFITGLASCTDRFEEDKSDPAATIPIRIEAGYPVMSRVTDTGFAGGDKIGVYVVDYNEGNPGVLKPEGNRGDNVSFTLDETSWRWTGSVDLFFKDDHTPVDIYGYYPYNQILDDVDKYKFTVRTDQNSPAKNGILAGYEASDLIWAKTARISPTVNTIPLSFRHLMSCLQITLTEGSGFSAGEWEKLSKSVVVPGLRHDATVSLAKGEVNVTGDISENHIITYVSGSDFRAVVVPQTIEPSNIIVTVTVGGDDYNLVKSESVTYTSGKKHKFTIRVDKKQVSGDFSFKLIDESVTAWLDDPSLHEGLVREYLLLNVSEAGKLSAAFRNKGWDKKTVEALKLTGFINAEDFLFLRDSLPVLNSLNMKEVIIKASDEPAEIEAHIPDWAFYNKSMLSHVVLPDSLRSVGINAFYGTNLTGSLVIPDGVVELCYGAFRGLNSLKGGLYLPETLKIIGGEAFNNCGFTSSLDLPDGVVQIGEYAFNDCENMNGSITLPSGLKSIGVNAFSRNPNIKGDIILPAGLTTVAADAFSESGFDGNIDIPEGVEVIENSAFSDLAIKGELKLPSTLKIIGRKNGRGAFENTLISGRLILPEGITSIDRASFKNCYRLNDTLVIPRNIQRISEETFYGCTGIEALVLPEELKVISAGAFANCTDIKSIKCNAKTPPLVSDDSFDFLEKHLISVEVPRGCVDAYRTAPVWREFARIAEYKGFVCRPMAVCALNKEHVEKIVINADGAWSVEYQPEWCNLSRTSGESKTEIELTLRELPHGQGNRSDSIVFRLSDGDYRTYCNVSQYDYRYEEDEVITLQKSSKGHGIDILFMGDGFDAASIANDSYINLVREQYGHFFNIEPYSTYKDYFNVYAAVALSQDTDINTLNTYSNTRFNTVYGGCETKLFPDAQLVVPYALGTGVISKDRLEQSLMIVVPNSTEYGGSTYYYSDGSVISVCSPSESVYPNDTRGILQHEAGGHGFGRLADEGVHYGFAPPQAKQKVLAKQLLGWYQNISVSSNMSELPWSHLVYDERYSDIVDIFEGGFGYYRSIYRSEINSCMNYGIPYYNTISRQSIVKRILESVGEEFTLEKFFEKDSRAWGNRGTSRGTVPPWNEYTMQGTHKMPEFINQRPSETKLQPDR